MYLLAGILRSARGSLHATQLISPLLFFSLLSFYLSQPPSSSTHFSQRVTFDKIILNSLTHHLAHPLSSRPERCLRRPLPLPPFINSWWLSRERRHWRKGRLRRTRKAGAISSVCACLSVLACVQE